MSVKNQLAATQKKPSFSAWLSNETRIENIKNVIGKANVQRFITSIISAVSVNQVLSECTFDSILAAAMLGESLKLSPSPQLGYYYMVPYDDKDKGKVAQFQIGYKGYLQLAMRTGDYAKINVLAIKEGELKHFDPLNEVIDALMIDDEESRESAPTVGYYAMFEYHNGFRKALYWSKKKMESHADKYSKAFHLKEVKNSDPKRCRVSYADFVAGKYPQNEAWKYSSFWYKDFDGMAYKTMIRQLLSKWGIMSIESDMTKAMENDMAVINDDGTTTYVEEGPEYDGVVIDAQPAEAVQTSEPSGNAESLFFDGQ